MNVSTQKVLEASDVTIVTRRQMAIYSFSNLFFFMVQLGALIILSEKGALSKVQNIFFHVIDENDQQDPTTIPIQMNDSFESLGWLGVVLLQFLFVMRGLSCMSPGPHYVNTMLLKIRFAFCLLCGILIFDVCTISLLLGTSFYLLFIPLFGFALLKMQVHYMLYLKVKYKDDGRELVTFADFITI
jgi:hypothetical protein